MSNNARELTPEQARVVLRLADNFMLSASDKSILRQLRHQLQGWLGQAHPGPSNPRY